MVVLESEYGPKIGSFRLCGRRGWREDGRREMEGGGAVMRLEVEGRGGKGRERRKKKKKKAW